MYLCYSNENKELYHCHSVKSNDDVLFTSYNDVGWKRTKNIIVPNSTFSFRIESNFGYEGHKYLRFRATYNDIELKNYESERSLCSRGLSDAFDVTPESESWDELFFCLKKYILSVTIGIVIVIQMDWFIFVKNIRTYLIVTKMFL